MAQKDKKITPRTAGKKNRAVSLFTDFKLGPGPLEEAEAKTR